MSLTTTLSASTSEVDAPAAVLPSIIFNSAVVTVAPSNILSSAGVEVIVSVAATANKAA